MIKRKAQEEMVGFVMIVVVVSVILVVILGIMMRNPATDNKNLEVTQFLESMMEYTTDCAIGYAPRYASVGELMGDCYDNKICVNGKNACEVLNKTINEIISASWPISDVGYYSGYKFNSIYVKENRSYNLLDISQGNCTLFRGGDSFFEHKGGVIDSTLKICTKA